MKPKISVIVPVYNVEKYIDKCLDSLLNQTYKNMELIIVNDCSTDNSKKIIEKKIKNHKNVLFSTNKENSGLSFTRNEGLKKATGDYIGYIDSDDYIPQDYYEILMDAILKQKADIAVCDMNIVYEETGITSRTVCGNESNLKIDFINNGLAASACNKLFKKELISKYEFSVGKVNEDLAVIIPTLINAKKIAYTPDTFYNYVQHDNSIQNSTFSEKRFDIFYGVKETLKRIKKVENYDEFKQVIVYQQLIMLFIYVIPKEKSIIKRAKWFKIYNKMIKKYNIRKNRYWWDFIDGQGTKHKYYYKLLLKVNSYGLSFFASLLVSFYNLYKKLFVKPIIKSDITISDLEYLAKKQNEMKECPISISVVIPNYNYSKFIYERLYSILSQNIKIKEFIILDDCSTDDSRKVIDVIYSKLKNYINIKKVYNEKNSGSAFKQWEKGFDIATSEYVWIAEADDYCDSKFLSNVVKPIIKDNSVVISYSDTAFIDSVGNIIMRTIKSEIDIMKTGHWDKKFVNSGIDEYNNYAFLNCTIANVSSTLIKKDDYKEFFKLSGKYKQAGDWLFYVNIMQKGKISFVNKPLNYYRVHGSNVSSVTKKESHIKEIENIHSYYRKTYGLNKKQEKEINKRYKFLKKVWNLK